VYFADLLSLFNRILTELSLLLNLSFQLLHFGIQLIYIFPILLLLCHKLSLQFLFHLIHFFLFILLITLEPLSFFNQFFFFQSFFFLDLLQFLHNHSIRLCKLTHTILKNSFGFFRFYKQTSYVLQCILRLFQLILRRIHLFSEMLNCNIPLCLICIVNLLQFSQVRCFKLFN